MSLIVLTAKYLCKLGMGNQIEKELQEMIPWIEK